ncbi:MAG: hypothetical protein LBD40_02695 [Puniceicoccales bacterium]|jgi:hypothetical protein|nr:hypothetical protein [Puniceicoccales bacterium]
MGWLCCGGASLAAPYVWDDSSPLVHVDDEEIIDPITQQPTLKVAPWFQELTSDFLYLVKRSYNGTKRRDTMTYYLPAEMMSAKVVIGRHQWYCLQNFAGTQGAIRAEGCGQSCLRCLLNCFSCCCNDGDVTAPEIDFPGSVAYTRHHNLHIIAVVLRGSQGELFQSAHGIFGPTWIDNFFAARQQVSADYMGIDGYVHAGYFRKTQSFLWDLKTDLRNVISRIPDGERDRIRFVCMGHSQGAGLATLLTPQLIHCYGKALFGEDFDNTRTPRFFCFALSSPMVVAGRDTQEAFEHYVGKDNILRFFVHRDIVTLAALRGYVHVGTPAIVSISDAIHRAIQADVAYNYRLLFYKKLKAQFNPELFDKMSENVHHFFADDQTERVQVAKDNPDKKLYWHYIKFLFTSPFFHYGMVMPQGLADLCNRARHMAMTTSLDHHAFPHPDHLTLMRSPSPEAPQQSTEKLRLTRSRTTISPLDHTLMRTSSRLRLEPDPKIITVDDLRQWMDPSFNWDEAQRIVQGDLRPEEIIIDPERREHIADIAQRLEQSVFRMSRGRNFLTTVDAFRDYLGANRQLNVSNLKFGIFPHDPEFLQLVDLETPELATDHIYPLSGSDISVIAILHSGAQDGKETAFNPHILGSDLSVALKNGQIETQKQLKMLDESVPLLSFIPEPVPSFSPIPVIPE